MKELGSRHGKRFHKLIHSLDLLSEIHVQATESPRTQDSAMEYLTGMFGTTDSFKIDYNRESDDFLLMYFHVCPKFIKVYGFI
jgi:hypothetical protein